MGALMARKVLKANDMERLLDLIYRKMKWKKGGTESRLARTHTHYDITIDGAKNVYVATPKEKKS
jgi:hypothetical protein